MVEENKVTIATLIDNGEKTRSPFPLNFSNIPSVPSKARVGDDHCRSGDLEKMCLTLIRSPGNVYCDNICCIGLEIIARCGLIEH